MHLSHSLILAILPFFASATPLAHPPTCDGTAISIAKHGGDHCADPTVHASRAHTSIANIARGMAAYQRNTGKQHPLASGIKTSSMRAGARVPLGDYVNYLWYATISIGTPPQNFTVDINTGKSDLFVASKFCDSSCSGHNEYDPSASFTARDLGQNITVNYNVGFGNSSISSKQYTDVVAIAGLVAKHQTLGAVTSYPTSLEIDGFAPDGMMGLAFPSVSLYGAPSPVQNLISEHVLTCPMFGTKLSPTGSELFLGGVNLDLFQGEITWVPLSHAGYWEASFNGITVDGCPVLEDKIINAIFDTGSTLIIGDSDRIGKLYAALEPYGAVQSPEWGEGTYTVPCNFSAPTISFYVGGKEIKISPEAFAVGPVFPGSETCMAGALANDDLTGEFWVLGVSFLENVYTAWDVGRKRIGFADLVKSG